MENNCWQVILSDGKTKKVIEIFEEKDYAETFADGYRTALQHLKADGTVSVKVEGTIMWK